MATFQSAGVYLRELDYSAYAARIAGSVIGFVGTATKGPIGIPQLLTSPSQGIGIFGKPLPTAGTKCNFGLHAAMNALNQTSQVWYVRVTDGTEKIASVSSPIVVNSQVVYLANDDDGITVTGGQLAFTLEIQVRPGAVLSSDAFNALTRQFGANSVFDASYNVITNFSDLLTAIDGSGAFVNVQVPLAKTDKTFENYEQFVARFNQVVGDGVLRAEPILVEDSVDGVQKFIAIKTQNLSSLLALNLEFKLTVDTATSPADTGYAQNSYDGGHPHSQLQVIAKKPGVIGNSISVYFTDVGNTFTGLPVVSVSGKVITVSINAGVTIASDVLKALDANSSARLLVTAINGAGSSGSATIQAGHVHLTSGGTNLPTSIVSPVTAGIGTVNLSTTWTQRYEPSTGNEFTFSASSAGEFANKAKLYFGKDSSGLETLEYREGNDAGEKATNLRIQPAGSKNSFLDALAGFKNLAAPAASEITLLTATAGQTLARGTVDVITDAEKKTFLTWNAFEFYSASAPALSGGRSGIPDDYNDLVGEVIGNAADRTGLYAFANRESYDNSLLSAPGFDQSSVIRAGLSIAETAGDLEFIPDPPAGTVIENGLTAQEIVAWHNGQGFGNTAAFNSSYGALYYGWVKTFDTFNQVEHWVPPSVLVLEQIAYSDNVGEVWFAPAGFRRGRLTKALDVQANAVCDQGSRDYMYGSGNAVNPLVKFPKDGVVIFGQRTLQRNASALDRLNVRRMLNYIKRASAAAVRYDLFEPNDKILWGQLSTVLKPIYQEVKNKRGINKFEVRFDDKTTPQLARDNNEVYGYIIIEPTKSAEKIILSFVITAQGASFSEALAAAGVV